MCLLDIEASLEHFSQSKALHAERILIVVEPYLRSLETGRRMIGLARQLFPERIELVINKVRDESELDSAHELSDSTGVEIAAVIPYDERLITAERAGLAPLDFDPDGVAVLAVAELADHLLASTVLQPDPQ